MSKPTLSKAELRAQLEAAVATHCPPAPPPEPDREEQDLDDEDEFAGEDAVTRR